MIEFDPDSFSFVFRRHGVDELKFPNRVMEFHFSFLGLKAAIQRLPARRAVFLNELQFFLQREIFLSKFREHVFYTVGCIEVTIVVWVGIKCVKKV